MNFPLSRVSVLFISFCLEIRHKREDVKEELDEEDLVKIVELDLVETETIWLLDIPGVCVSSEGDDAPLVQEQLARYQEVNIEI